MSRVNKGGVKTTKMEDFERYFAEIIVSNFQNLEKEDFVFVELMMRTMGEQLVEDKIILSLDKIEFDKVNKKVRLEFQLPVNPLQTAAYLPMSTSALELSWKNLTGEQISNRKCDETAMKLKGLV